MKIEKVACTVPGCTAMVKKAGLKSHIRMKHNGAPGGFVNNSKAQLADVTAKFTASEARVKELEARLADVKPEVDRIAVLSDWMESLTSEAWQRIGEERGYLTEVKPAAVADAQPVVNPEPAPVTKKSVYMADLGITATIKDGK